MPSSGDAHIDFTEEVTPDKGSLNKLAKTFIPFILLFLTKAGYQFVNFIKSNASQKDIKLFVAPKCFLYRFETRYTVELCRIGFL